MAVTLDDVRKLALGLADATEEPHHDFGSFRVRGRIFVTIPPGGAWLHVFLPEPEREQALAIDPEFLEPLRWGRKVLGVRVRLPLARKATVLALVRRAHAYRAAGAPRSWRRKPADAA